MRARRILAIATPLLGAAVFAALYVASCGAPPRQARTPRPGERTLRVLTYNVNYGIPGDGASIDAILSTDADVVFLQETNEAWESALGDRVGPRYPHRRFEHAPAAGGSAVLSKREIDEVSMLEPPEGGWFRAMRVVLTTEVGRLQVLSVHLRPQLGDDGSVVSGVLSTGPVRRAEIEAHLEALDPELPAMVVGDFNEKDGSALAYLGERGFENALNEFGAHDTWRWNTSVGEVSSQLDHVMYQPPLEPLEARVITAGRSDHMPVLVVFTIDAT